MYLHRIVILLSLFLSFEGAADTNSSSPFYEAYIDQKQKVISNQVINLFDSIDRSLSNRFSNSNNYADYEKENSVDEFFKNNKYINETEKSFLRVRFGSLVQSKDSTLFSYKISAHVPLSRTKKDFNLFIESIENNYLDDTASETMQNTGTPEIGVNFFAEEFHGIESKYSLGLRGFSAFLRARYSKSFKVGEVTIQPTQQFKYSTKDYFQEETNLYIDKTLNELSLFRTALHRKTKQKTNGMDYKLAFTYFYTPKKRTGLSLTQYFWGNTKYTCPIKPKPYGGISEYKSVLSWRQNILRKWFIYEIQPGVSFHRQYNYKTNYMLRLNLDFYFGSM